MTAPLLQGGQGRTPQDIESDGAFLLVAIVAGAVAVLIYVFVIGGAS